MQMNSFTTRGISATLLCVLFFPSTALAYEAAPVSLTKQATFVTEKSARLNGQGNPNQMPDAYSWFEWGVSGQINTVYETPHQALSGWSGGNTLMDTSADIIGLAPSTQYFYRHIVESGRGRDVGQTTYVTTKPRVGDAPTLVIVETNSPSRIADGTVTLRGYVSPHGNANTNVWFEWGPSQRLEAQTPSVRVSGQSAPFESVLNNLSPGTIYFYRFVGENSVGRVYGAVRVFTTTGTPPPPPEKENAQQVSRASTNGDGVARTTTNSGTKLAVATTQSSATFNNSGDATYGLPGVSADFRPGDILGAFLKKKNTTPTPAVADASSGNTTSGASQVASVGASRGVLATLWDTITGKEPIEITVEKVGPKTVEAHTAVEYKISYHYNSSIKATNARIAVTLPSTVVYIGDNTANELLLENGQNGSRTYMLPLGNISEGYARTFSILGMTTGDAKGFPDAGVELIYQNIAGVQHVLPETTKAKSSSVASTQTAGVTNSVSSSLDGKSVRPLSKRRTILSTASDNSNRRCSCLVCL